MRMQVITGKRLRPRRTLLYGPHGIGKSTWAAHAPSPLFLSCEDGLDDIGVDRTPTLKHLTDVQGWLVDFLAKEDHGYQTVVIDTVDWLEKLVWKRLCESAQKDSIEDFGFGKGYTKALDKWSQIITALNVLRNERDLNIVLLAHAKVLTFRPPDEDSYDRYEPDLHRHASSYLQEWADEVLFATRRVYTIAKDEGFNRERTRAVGDGERIVHTCEKPTHMGKRRLLMPDVIPLDWTEYQRYWPGGNVAEGNTAGTSSNEEQSNG